ncbi:MAG: hypothetical protein KIT36_18040 [Alphaproteobacteria bacterium]|nr:hypothetical protein [Alphaproteobacteria bacterium]
MRRFLKRLFTPPLVVIAALLMLLEETLIAWLQQLMATLARLPWVAALEARAARLPPYPAMALFLLPVIILFPVKVGAVWLLAEGKVLLGGAVLLVGKVVGTAFAARIYKLLHPALATLAWFVRVETWVFGWRDRLYAAVKAMPAWQAAADVIRRGRAWLRTQVQSLRRQASRPGSMSRRLAAIRRRSRRSA